MDHQNDEEGALSSPDPPPYSEKELYYQEPPPAYVPATPAEPTQYPPYYSPYSAVPGQGPDIQPPTHAIYIIPVEPPQAPDYLAYSIFTMLCCCLPLGIAALVYSIRTRDANRMGHGAKAQEYSWMARILAKSALCMGAVLIKITILIRYLS